MTEQTQRAHKVSIVIPTYNSADYIVASVESALQQSYENIEVIVVDDGSTDNTHEVLLPYLSQILYFKQKNAGLAGARNTGHQLATGDYIAWLDADDIAHPERIALQVAYLDEHSDTVLLSSDFATFNASGLLAPCYIDEYYSRIKQQAGIQNIYSHKQTMQLNNQNCTVYNGDLKEQLILGNIVHPPTTMIRRSAIRQAGLLNNTVPSAEDWHYFIKLANYGTFAYIDKPLLNYRLSETQMTSIKNNGKQVFESILGVIDLIEIEEPTLFAQYKTALNSMRADFNASAADALCDKATYTALKFLAYSVKYKLNLIRQLKIFIKIITPQSLSHAMRNIKNLLGKKPVFDF